MSLKIVQLSPGYFPSPSIGRPISNADIFVGIPDLDPEILGNQKQISIQEENGDITPISQPISTGSGGVPLFNGSPVTILAEGNHSLKVLDKQGSQIYFVPNVAGFTQNEEVEDIFGLVSILNPTDGDTTDVLGFFVTFPQSKFKGGGLFVWQTELDKTLANGGTIIDPDNIGGFDGSPSTRDAFLAAQGGGSGTGCWVRIFSCTTNVYMFGAEGTGAIASDDSGAFQATFDNSVDVHIPLGTYKLTTPITFEALDKRRSIFGDGASTQIVPVFSVTGSTQWVFESVNVVMGFFGKMRLVEPFMESAPTVDIGLLKVDSSLRGMTIEQTYVWGLYHGIFLGGDVFAKASVRDYHHHILTDSAASIAAGATSITCNGNTVFMDGLDIIGGFFEGVAINTPGTGDTEVLTIKNFNIAGASDTRKMRTAIRMTSVRKIGIEAGWIEQIDQPGTVGRQESILIENGTNISVRDLNLAAGSIYIDNVTQGTFDNISFGNANAGIFTKDPTVENDISIFNLHQQSTSENDMADFGLNYSGKITVVDEDRYHMPKERYIALPFISSGFPAQISNDPGDMSSAQNLVTYLTGNRAMTVNAKDNFGLKWDFAGLLSNQKYTFVCWAQVSAANTDKIFLSQSIGSHDFRSPQINFAVTQDEWRKLFRTYKTDGSGDLTVLLKADVNDANFGQFILDSTQLWLGVRSDDPS